MAGSPPFLLEGASGWRAAVPLGAMRGGGVRMLGRRPQGFLAGLGNHGCVGSVGGRPWLPVAADLGFLSRSVLQG